MWRTNANSTHFHNLWVMPKNVISTPLHKVRRRPCTTPAARIKVLASKLEHGDRPMQARRSADWLGEHAVQVGGGARNAGRPRLFIRLMASLLCLRHSFNLSDEELVERWSENVVFQFSAACRVTSRVCRATPRRLATFAVPSAKRAWSNCSWSRSSPTLSSRPSSRRNSSA